MHTKLSSLMRKLSRIGTFVWAGWLVVFCGLFIPDPGAASTLSEQELGVFRHYFDVLEGGGPVDELLDRSRWPNNDDLASYVELELLFHHRYGATLPRLLNFLKRWPNHAHKKRLEKMVEVRIAHAASENDVLAWYDHHPPVTKAAKVYYTQLLLDRKRVAEAQSIWVNLYLDGVSFPSELLKGAARFDKLFTPAEQEKRARNLILKGNHKTLARFVESLPADRRDYFLALDAATSGDARQFSKYHPRLEKKDANSPEMWYARMEWMRNNGSLSKLHTMLLGREGRYLNSDDRCTLRFRLARVFYNGDRLDDAYELLNMNVLEKGAQLEDSLWMAAWSAYRLNHKNRALELFKLLGSEGKTDQRRSQGAWWAAELSVSPEEKRLWINQAAQFPDSFYGLLALETRDGRLPELHDPQLDCSIVKDPGVQGEVQRMHWLREIGRNFYNGLEIENLAGRRHLSSEERLCLATHTGAYDYALKLAQELKGGGKQYYWSGLYPLPHWKPSSGWELDPALIWGTVRQESTFLPRAQSGVHARGLMQLMPTTADEVARKGLFPQATPFRLHDPAYNLALGQAYLKRMLQGFDGDLVLALSSYNAGPGRGRSWSERRRMESALTFIENIPFNETRNYVKLVINGVAHYQLRLYGKGSIWSLVNPGAPGPGKLMM
ncbi:MAG: lytic transglycosylase domain-containing protein [Magnetococcales bacterium]|nr:lytic transglycosylase domain-containing protein [Magnetococcales bacterium]